MKYAVEMGTGVMIFMPSFIRIGSGIQKMMWWGEFTDRQTDRQTIL
jgi:hypothetical protein